MKMFIATANQMILLFICILVGYYLRKTKKVDGNASTVVSKLLNEIFIPALLISTFSKNCTLESLLISKDLLLYGIGLLVLQVVISFVLTPFFTKDKSERGIYLYSLAVVNFSFMGNSIVQALYGSEMLFKYLMFSLPITIFAFSVGFIWLTAGKEKFTIKRLLNPTIISVIIGILIGLFNIKLPIVINNTLNALSACFSPMAMILTGVVIGGFDLRKLFNNVKIYVLTIVRCIVLPLVILFTAKVLHLNKEVLCLAIFHTAMPLGLNTIVFPAAYGGDTTPGASMAVISNILGLISVPIFLMLFA